MSLFEVIVTDISLSFCGGKIGNSGLQAYIAPVLAGITSCKFRSYSVTSIELREIVVFVRAPHITR